MEEGEFEIEMNNRKYQLLVFFIIHWYILIFLEAVFYGEKIMAFLLQSC